MKKQPEPFAVATLGTTFSAIEGNGLFVCAEENDGKETAEFVAYLNQLIEERALLLAALQQVRTALDGRDEYIDGAAVDTAIKKATT